jgi:enoyl-CoA hydratase
MSADNSTLPIILEHDGPVATITINDPMRRNALDRNTFSLISKYCDAIDKDLSRGALVIRGADGHFCSGAVRSILDEAGADPLQSENFILLSSIYDAVARIGSVKVPVIAAVRGAAVGAGFNLALAADVRIVSLTAKLVSGFAPIGMHPGGGHFNLLTRSASREVAAATSFFSSPISGERALQLGLAWEALDDTEVDQRALDLAHQVAKDPALARAMKRSLVTTVDTTWQVATDAERSIQMWSLRRKHETP